MINKDYTGFDPLWGMQESRYCEFFSLFPVCLPMQIVGQFVSGTLGILDESFSCFLEVLSFKFVR